MNIEGLERDVRVHGDIRHLEKHNQKMAQLEAVHGDIRHLEMFSKCFA